MLVEFNVYDTSLREKVSEDDYDIMRLSFRVPPKSLLTRHPAFLLYLAYYHVMTKVRRMVLQMGSYFFPAPVYAECRIFSRLRVLTLEGSWKLVNSEGEVKKQIPNYRDLYIQVDGRFAWVNPALRDEDSLKILHRVIARNG